MPGASMMAPRRMASVPPALIALLPPKRDPEQQTCFPELGLERISRLGKFRSFGSSDEGRPGGKEATASQDATAKTRSRVGWFLK